MIRTQSVFIFLFTLTIGFNSLAQNNVKDPKAKAILDKLSEQTEGFKSIQLKFDYKIINNQTKQEKSYKGYTFMQKDRYKIIIPTVEIISDGESMWTYQKEIGEVSIDYIRPEEDNIFNPAKLFTIYKRGYKYKLIGSYKRKAMNISIIDLFPESPDKKSFTRVRIEIDTEKNRIVSLTTFGKDGIDYVIEIQNTKPNIKIPEGFFTFKKEKYPKDIEIIDLR
ncbi:MAG: outer membrane lipoprotein carrier protein LolA [Bacteroidota bacterium]|nr:outer membrane lipoprotein carrier protein LolA [Bacteroidota bacterium]